MLIILSKANVDNRDKPVLACAVTVFGSVAIILLSLVINDYLTNADRARTQVVNACDKPSPYDPTMTTDE